jgi:hypothetical protein
MSQVLEDQLSILSAKIERIDDELAIQKLIVRYGLAVDCGDAEQTMALFTEDTVFDVGTPDTGREGAQESSSLKMEGRAAVGEMVMGEGHQSLLPNCAHTIGPVVIEVDGSNARATGYTRIYHQQDGEFRLFRLGINHWELVKEHGKWLIEKRASRVLGQLDAQRLLRNALA